jgi:hypothetical protein
MRTRDKLDKYANKKVIQLNNKFVNNRSGDIAYIDEGKRRDLTNIAKKCMPPISATLSNEEWNRMEPGLIITNEECKKIVNE